MTKVTKLLSLLALLVTVAPSILYFTSVIDHSTTRLITLIGSLMWFMATPLWMGREVDESIQTEF